MAVATRSDQEEDRLTETFAALANPTRRAILARLATGAANVNELAEPFDMSLPAISKHIKVLEGAGLVARRTEWREHLIEVRMEPLAEIDRWFAGLRSIWALRLEALDTLIGKGDDRDD